MSDTPASFLPPPKRERKHYADQPLLEVPADGQPSDLRLAALEAEALAENPDVGRAVPWQRPTAKERGKKLA